MASRGLQTTTLLTILGPVPYPRSRFECPTCGAVRYPGDEELDVVGTTRSPGVRRMMARAGRRQTFKEGRDDLRVYAGLTVSAKDVERVAEGIGRAMEAWQGQQRAALLALPEPPHTGAPIPKFYVLYDGTGVPMVQAAVAGRKGKQPDGTAKTREAKLGCVFTQTIVDAEGRPVRDPDSTSFVGAIEGAEAFGERIYAEALRRGLADAALAVVLGDGAVWIWNLADLHFPGAVQIVDLFHAKEHVAALAKLLFPGDEREQARRRLAWWTVLEAGDIERLAAEARAALPADAKRREEAETGIAYFETHRERMRYAEFRRRGLFVGSGVIEAGCKTVVAQRLKQSGMEWTVDGANAIIALRCVTLSGRLEDYWEDRAAA